jgi:Sel1 repeat
MKKWNIYQKNSGEIKAVKEGFNWWAFLFPGLWAFSKGLNWAGAIGLSSGITAYQTTNPVAASIFIFVPMFIYGFLGNGWVAAKLEKQGYTHLKQVEAASVEGAKEKFNEAFGPTASSGTALKQTKALADQGNANEQYNLGVMCAYGQGVAQDYQEALKWFRLSAAQGNPEAQGDLGAMYQAGFGVPQDYAQAMMWYLIAKAGGTTLADQNLQQLESLSAPAQIAEAQRMAREWSAAHHPKN